MLTAAFAAGVLDLCTAIIAVEFLSSFFDPRPGADTTAASAPAPLLGLDGMFGLLLPLSAVVAIYAAVVSIHRHLRQRHAAGAAGTRRLWWSFTVLCTAAGTLHLFFFVLQPEPAGGVAGGDAGAQALRSLGLAAARAQLAAAAVACFFLGMVVIFLAHVHAGGEGGGGGAFGGVAADGQIRFLTKAAFGAAAAVVWLMGMSSLYAVTSNFKY